MKYCIKCGTELSDEAIYCSKCGTNQNEPTAEQPIQSAEIIQAAPENQATKPENPFVAKVTDLTKGDMNLPAAISAGVLLISLFFPYVRASILGYSVSVSLIQGWEGKLLFLISLAGIGCSIINKFMKFEYARLCAAGEAAVAFLLTLISMISAAGSLNDYKDLVHKSFGFYLGFLAAIAFAIFAIIPAIPDIKALLQSKKQ